MNIFVHKHESYFEYFKLLEKAHTNLHLIELFTIEIYIGNLFNILCRLQAHTIIHVLIYAFFSCFFIIKYINMTYFYFYVQNEISFLLLLCFISIIYTTAIILNRDKKVKQEKVRLIGVKSCNFLKNRIKIVQKFSNYNITICKSISFHK